MLYRRTDILVHIIVISVAMVGLSVGASLFEHVAALGIGMTKAEVLPNAEHIFGAPLRTSEITDGQLFIELRIYKYDIKQDIVLYFYLEKLIQVEMIPSGETNVPQPRQDFENPKSDEHHPKAYLVNLKGKKISITPVWTPADCKNKNWSQRTK